MTKNHKSRCKNPAIALFVLCIIGCSPSNHPVYDDSVNAADLNRQVSISADLAMSPPGDLGQTPRMTCENSEKLVNKECCFVWCDNAVVFIQTGKWRINDSGDFFCDYYPARTSFDCSSAQMRCDERSGGCVR